MGKVQSMKLYWPFGVSWSSCVGRKSGRYKLFPRLVPARLSAHTAGSADSKWPVYNLHWLDIAILHFIYSMVPSLPRSIPSLKGPPGAVIEGAIIFWPRGMIKVLGIEDRGGSSCSESEVCEYDSTILKLKITKKTICDSDLGLIMADKSHFRSDSI